MKKAILLSLVLMFVGVFCQAESAPLVTMAAELQTGLRDVISFAGSTVTDAVSLYDIDSGYPSRFRIGLGFTSPDSNWGITTRLESDNLTGPSTGAGWNRPWSGESSSMAWCC
jgi:hypothetical protein